MTFGGGRGAGEYTVNGFCKRLAMFGYFTERPGLLLRGRAYHREIVHLTERLVLPQKGQGSQRDVRHLTVRHGFSQRGETSHRQARPLTISKSLTHRGKGLSQRGRDSQRQGISQGGRASHRATGPLIEGLKKRNMYILTVIKKYQICVSRNNLPFTKNP